MRGRIFSLILVMSMAVLLWSGGAWAQMDCDAYNTDLNLLETPTTYTIVIDSSIVHPESTFKKIALLWSTNNPPTTHTDSLTSGITWQDTIKKIDLTPGLNYYWRLILTDSVATCTTAIQNLNKSDLCSLPTFTRLSAYTHSWLNLEIEPGILPDSNYKKWVVLFDTLNPPTVHAESLITSINSSGSGIDTIKMDGLIKGKTYYAILIATDSLRTDTSVVSSAISTRASFNWSGIDSIAVGHSSFSVKFGYTEAWLDSGKLVTAVLLWNDSNNVAGAVAADSDITALGTPDTILFDGLTDNTLYYFWIQGRDSTAYDTSAVDSARTLNYQVTCYDDEVLALHTSLAVVCSTAYADSGNQKITLLLDKNNPPTTHKDSVTTTGTNPDTFIVNGLEQNTKYYFRAIIRDSTVAETSVVDSATTLDLTQTHSLVDTTTSRFKVKVNVTNSDSGINSIVILCSTVNPPTVRADSDITALNGNDTVQVDGLVHQTKYYYRVIVADSAFTDTSAVDSVTLEGMTITVACVETLYDDLVFGITYSNVDSAAKEIKLVIRTDVLDSMGTILDCASDPYCHVDSDLTNLGSPDTLNIANAPLNIRNAEPDVGTVLVMVIITDSTQTDSSVTDIANGGPYYTINFPYPTNWADRYIWNPAVGNYKTGATYTKSSYSFNSPGIYIVDKAWMALNWILFGNENNATYDSTIVYVQTLRFGDWTSIDTVVNRDIDTVTSSKYWNLETYLLTDSSGSAQTSLYNWGDSARFRVVVTDSSGGAFSDSTLDERGFMFEARVK